MERTVCESATFGELARAHAGRAAAARAIEPRLFACWQRASHWDCLTLFISSSPLLLRMDGRGDTLRITVVIAFWSAGVESEVIFVCHCVINMTTYNLVEFID